MKRYATCAAVLLIFVGVSLYPVCGAAFRCGCNIHHGAAHCNVHESGVPHCPWCSAAWWVVGANFAAIFGATGASAYAGLRWWRTAWAGIAAGGAGYLVTSAVATLVTAWLVGYPVWMGLRLR
jgi:hypothetical protein